MNGRDEPTAKADRSRHRYAKYRWDEDRDGEHADWGQSWWYFEFDRDGSIVRQVEEYDSGVRLRYSADHLDDEFGFLAEGRESEFDRPADEMLSADQFETVWSAGPWHNDPAGPRLP